MLLALGRTFKEGARNFVRNGWLSLATVSILILSLYVVSVLLMVTFTADTLLKNIQDKANISIYFKADVAESEITQIKNKISQFDGVKSIAYVNKDQALQDFRKNNENEPIIIQSLDELGGNPLLDSLVIRANSSEQYDAINQQISKADFSGSISRINYGKNKEVIDKLNSIVATVKRVGIGLEILFAAISILITFNSIRINIYSRKQEIEIMRLVGASNMYIRLPFIFEGIIYGVAASLLSMIILLITAKFFSPYISTAIPSSNLVSAYIAKFWVLFGAQLIIGVALGTVSSMIAIRRYLKI